MNETEEHPSFILAKSLDEPWREHFPKNQKEAEDWKPWRQKFALSMKVLVVCQTRIECGWAAYCDAVPGGNHTQEMQEVLLHGTKLPENIARILFPTFGEHKGGVPYIL